MRLLGASVEADRSKRRLQRIKKKIRRAERELERLKSEPTS